jgi:4-hydroxy-tetrahydrodipicolinate reductase
MVISGCYGHMGRVLTRVAVDDAVVEVVAGFDVAVLPLGASSPAYPVYACPSEFDGVADVIVDFSVPDALDGLLSFALSQDIPLVLCATGYSPEQVAAIEGVASKVPIFRSGNMSLGINLLIELVGRACAVLGDSYDVEIVERHHRRKIDAPSGTALMLADAAASALLDSPDYVFERESRRVPRKSGEIGISAVRGGTIVGEHDVILAGLDEVIELKHSAASRDVFAVGAVKAAKFMAKIGKPGMYSMKDVLLNS